MSFDQFGLGRLGGARCCVDVEQPLKGVHQISHELDLVEAQGRRTLCLPSDGASALGRAAAGQ